MLNFRVLNENDCSIILEKGGKFFKSLIFANSTCRVLSSFNDLYEKVAGFLEMLQFQKKYFRSLKKIFFLLCGFHFGLWRWKRPLRRPCYSATSDQVNLIIINIYVVLYISPGWPSSFSCHQATSVRWTHQCYGESSFSSFLCSIDTYRLVREYGRDRYIKRGR